MRFSVPGRFHSRPRLVGLAAVIGLAIVGVSVLVASPVVARLLHHGDLTSLAAEPSGSLGPVPPLTHAYVIVLENRAYEGIVGSPDAPYLNSLIARYGLAQSYQAVAHPSQPNYVALVSGSTNGVTDDEPHDINAPNVFDQLEQAGRTWRVFAEDYPGGCFTGATATDGRDGTGTYARKHNPAISFPAISGTPSRCANIQDLTSFDPAAADVEFIIPNQCHDMHSCSTAEGDAWLKQFVPTILDSATYKSGGALFITFDESSDADKVSNHVATIVASPLVPAGSQSAVPHTHYSLLRTLEDAWHLPCLADSCSANNLGEFFH